MNIGLRTAGIGRHRSSGGGSVALVAHTQVGGNFVTPQTTPAINTTGANFLVCIVSTYDNGTQTGITDSKSNTWQQLVNTSQDNGCPRIFYSYNPTVGSGHTVTFTSADGSGIAFAAFSGMLTTSSVYESGTLTYVNSSSSGTTVQAGSNTPNNSGDLVICGLGGIQVGGPCSISGGFTILDNISTAEYSNPVMAYLITTSTASNNPTWTVTANNNRIEPISAVFAQV